MSRARKPLAAQKGDLTTARQVAIQQAEDAVTTGNEQLENPPEWLISAMAKKEWSRVTKELQSINIVGNLDVNNIAGYCNAYSLYRTVVKGLAADPFDKTLADLLKKYAEEMRKFASLCGLTIDSRLKAGAYMADKKEEEINTQFGDI